VIVGTAIVLIRLSDVTDGWTDIYH